MSHVQWYITLSEILLLISVLFGIDFRRGTRDIQRKGEEIGEVGEEKSGKKALFKEEKLEKNKNPRTWYYSSREVRG